MSKSKAPVLFFDGDCGLCSRSVRFLMARDRSHLLYFAPLQGETAARRVRKELQESLSTVVYERSGGEVLVRSEAVLQALIDIGSRWRFFARAALCLPRGLRDAIYKLIADQRKNFFLSNNCPLPSSDENQRILP